MNPKIEKILKLPRYQRGLILLGIVCVIVGLFVWLIVMPQQEELSRLAHQQADLKVKIEADRRVAANLPVYKAELEKMTARLNQALTELPNDKEIPTLLTSISSTAKSNGLEVLTFKPGEEVPKGFYAEVPVTLKLQGTFHQLATFFYKVGTLPRIVNIGNVKIGTKSSNKDNSGATRLSVDCQATTFRFIEGADAKTAATGGKGKAK